MKQYYPRDTEMPEAGDVVRLVSRKKGASEKLGYVTRVYRDTRMAIIRPLSRTERARLTDTRKTS